MRPHTIEFDKLLWDVRPQQSPALRPAATDATDASAATNPTAQQTQLHSIAKDLTAALRQIADQARQQHVEMTDIWQQSCRRAAVTIGMAAAAELLERELEGDRLRLQRLVDRLLQELPAAGLVQVFVNPEDLTLLQEAAPCDHSEPPASAAAGQQPREGELTNWPDLQLVADASLQRGCCRVEDRQAGLLHDWRSRVAEIHQLLLERVSAC